MESPATVFKTNKARGEWVELCFMAKAAGMGLPVSKPYGDSARYDVGVDRNGRVLRVQIKSTMRNQPGTPYYALRLVGSQERPYVKGEVDFFAAYLIPIDAWYILPFEEA
jgi:hypothetical protein